MAERDNHMEHLVDAFRGLAEGDGQSNYLADVEAIVNSYFKSGSNGVGGPRPATPTRAVPTRQAPSPPQQQRGLYDDEADAARPDAYDVLGESPIKPALFSGRSANAATAATAAAHAHAMDASHSSGGSLQAWGTAAEDIHNVAVATRRIGEQRGGGQQQQQQQQQRVSRQQQQAPPVTVVDDESAQLAETQPQPQPQQRQQQGDDGLHGRDVDLQLLPEYDDDFYTRSVEWQRRQTEQRSKQKSAVKDKETEGCTWRPAINKYTYTNSGRLVYGKVEDRLVASESARQQRLEDERRRREERETEGCTFKPRVNTASGLGSQINSRYMDTAHSISQVSARSAGAAGGGGGPQQETFERLYRQGRKSRGQQDEQPPPGTPTPVLYTTFNPSRPPPGGHVASRLNMSVEEIEATERELSDIEALLTQRMLQTGRIAVVESNYEDSDGDDGAHDVTGYTEDSDASASRGTADFSTFLMRQNAFEERRRANLAYIEAETAAPLHPTITQRSLKMKTDKTRDKAGRPPADVQRQRLQKLAAESIELHVEVERVHAECGALLRKINLVRKLPGAGRVSAAVSSLQAELRTLRLTDKETGEYHASLKPGKKELKVCPDDDVLSRVLLDRDRGKTLRPAGEQLQAWLREMVEVRNGLAELRTLSTRVRDALAREKDDAVKANEGKIPWEVMAEMECPRSRGGGSGGGGSGLGGASRVEQGEKAKPGEMLAVVGDRVRARREDWQAWQQGELVSIEGGKAMVTVEGCKKPQPFPANVACVVVAPSEETDAPLHPTLRVKENALRHCIRTKEPVSVRLGIIGQSLRGRVITGEGKTWTVAVLDPEGHSSRLVRKTVSIDAIKLDHEIGSENYAPELVAARHGGNSLYISNLKAAQREAAQKQSEAEQEKNSKEEAKCTYRPHINTAPRYVKRMAQSMQLLRGEDN